jgi:excisionase family DNA binding protein
LLENERRVLHGLHQAGKLLAMSATLSEPLLNVREASEVLSVSKRTVYDLIAAGELPAFRVGGQLRLSRAALTAWLEANATSGGSALEMREPGFDRAQGSREDERGQDIA